MQAYHDHLQGQKHKKKVAKSKPEQTKGKGTTGGNLPVFVCELCDIECTAADAYAAHLRGAKHTKVIPHLRSATQFVLHVRFYV